MNNKPLTFGKYKGHSPNEIAKFDPSYIVWMFQNVKHQPCDKTLANSCRKIMSDYDEDRLDDMHFGLDGW